MKQDERGYVLILVLVTMAALAVLSLAAIQVNLAANKQTVFRVDETQLDTDVKSVLNVLVADVRKTFPIHDKDVVEDYMKSQAAFQAEVDSILAVDQLYTGSRHSDLNEIRYSISRSATDRLDAPFTSVLTLSATGTTRPKAEQPIQTVTYTQDVYLTALPSFLYYVLGSDDVLTINGPPNVSGNVYAGKQLGLKRDANYQLGSSVKTLANTSTSRFFMDGRIDLGDTATCTGCEITDYFATSTTPGATDRPDIGPVESSFSKFNFDYSIVQYVNRHINDASYVAYGNPEASIFGSGRFSEPSAPPFIAQTYTLPGQTEPTTRLTEFIDRNKLDAITGLKHIKSPTANPIVISESIASSTVPLLFDGDVVIEGTRAITIRRPLIVNGNLTIRGNVAFDTTVYALKDAFIDRAEIRGVSSSQDSSLVLLAKGKVLLNRIDEFRDTSSPLQAFMYSDSIERTRVYAVGSIVNIKGGLYSKGPLEINTFRGTFQPLPVGSPKESYFLPANATPSDDFAKSRLVMEYNEGVFEQISTLPVTNQLQLFVSQPVKR